MTKRILVVDDEPTILSSVATRLRAEGFVVDTAADGPSAVQAAEATAPDLVVLDVMLPGFDGLACLAERPRTVVSRAALPAGLGLGASDTRWRPPDDGPADRPGRAAAPSAGSAGLVQGEGGGANATRHSPPGGRVQLRAGSAASGLQIEVSDEGPGIEPGQRDRVFERFTRGESSDGGTGLGLAIARWAVDLHGGTIDVVDGAPGCRIRVVIPEQEGKQ